MGKEKKHIDDLFKDHLKGQPLALDGSEWDRLYADLHPEKKRRGFWWFILAGLLIAGAGTAIYFLLGGDSASPQETVSSEKHQSDTPEKNDEGKTQDLSPTDGAIDQQDHTEKQDLVTLSKPDLEPTGEKPVETGGGTAQKVDPQDGTVKKGSNNTNGSDEKIPSPESDRGFEPLTLNPHTTINLIVPQVLEALPIVSNKLGLLPDLTPDPKPKVYLGLDLGANRMTQQLSSGIPFYVSIRQQNESPSILPDLGASLKMDYEKFTVCTGVHFLQKGQTNSQVLQFLLYDSIPHRNTNGDTIGWGYYNYRDTLVHGLRSPRYSYLSVPVSFGKSFELSDKWSLEAGINSNIQLLLSSSGYVLNERYEPASLQHLSDLRRLSLTYGGYIGVGYSVDYRTKIILITHYDSDARNMMQNADIRQRMSGFGANVSVQFRLK